MEKLMLRNTYCLPATESWTGSPSVVCPSELAASNCSADSLMSLLCLELRPPGEFSASTIRLTLFVGVGS